MSKKSMAEMFADIEFNADETADTLLLNAIEAISEIVKHHDIDAPTAILIVGHAAIAKLDSMDGRHISAMDDLRESVDFLAANHNLDAVGDIPTEREREIIYRALEGEFTSRGDGMFNRPEIEAARLRFKKIAGL
jgi:hypothetical protein